jgi:hypothetical protein
MCLIGGAAMSHEGETLQAGEAAEYTVSTDVIKL